MTARRRLLPGAGVGVLMAGTAAVAVAGFLPVRPAVPEPPGWLGATWVLLPALILIVTTLAVLAVVGSERRTGGFRFWCAVLAALALWPFVWSVGYAVEAMRGGLPVLAPPLFAIGFLGILLGAVVLAIRGPQLHGVRTGAAIGTLATGAVVAAVAGWIAVGFVDATTADRVDVAAVPADPSDERWAWQADGQHVLGVVTAGAGVVVRTEDGVVAIDGRTGKERWHYRHPNTRTIDLAASPGGNRVMVSFGSTADDAEGTRVLALDAMTGEVGFDEVTDGGVFGGVRVELTDHVLIGGDESVAPTVVRGYDLQTGERRWEFTKPARCRWSNATFAPVSAGDTVLFGFVCGPLRSPQPDVEVTVTLLALDDQTGKERWRFERTVPTQGFEHSDAEGKTWYGPTWTVRQYLNPSVDGQVVQFGWGDDSRHINQSYVLDTADGHMLANGVPQPKLVELSGDGMLVREPITAERYQFRGFDGKPKGPVEWDEVGRGRERRATDRALVGLVVELPSTLRRDPVRATVELAPWDGGPTRRVPVDLGRTDVNVLYNDPQVEVAPGAVVVWHRDTTRIVGIG